MGVHVVDSDLAGGRLVGDRFLTDRYLADMDLFVQLVQGVMRCLARADLDPDDARVPSCCHGG